MPNKRFNNMQTDKKGPVTGKKGSAAPMPMGSPNWPGLPGKSQSKDRSNGVTKLKGSVKQIGL